MKRTVFVSLCCAVACAMPAYANINTGGEKGVVHTTSAQAWGAAKLNVGFGVNYDQDGDFVKLSDGSTATARLFSSNLFMALGLTNWWDLAISLPLYWDGNENLDISDFGLGDFEVTTKLLAAHRSLFYQSFLIGLTIPTGISDKGIYTRRPFYYDRDYKGASAFSADHFVAFGKLLITLDVAQVNPDVAFRVHLNGGVYVPDTRAITGLVSLALEYDPVHVVTIFADFAAEMRAQSVLTDQNKIRQDYFWLNPGVRINAPVGVYVMLAANLGVVSDPDNRTPIQRDKKEFETSPMPLMGVQFAFGFSGFLSAQDDDKDGIKNNDDRCPKDAEDHDNFEDNDGCPDEDNDKDGIPDAKDKCQGKEEDKDGFEDEDGCPDPDNDSDGIDDLKDRCPKVAEDFDGFEDKDGCPDEDNDKDGVPDSLDKCRNDVEDFDKFEDDDGCPDVDNDKDGILDLKDKCPNEPENFNNLSDEDGCPDKKKAKSKMPKHQVVRGVNFKSGRAEMTFDSYAALDPIIKELKKFPDIEIEIRGHTDSVGKYSSNMRLSQLRAEAVKQYFVNKGISVERMRSVGFGSSSPIADNRTAAGRAQNRRIEIVRIK
ncbi:MAG: OmpA family protein [Chitinivibrionales bacterium]|nr:OmpA family protein [Chitinivibrionales bacterium]